MIKKQGLAALDVEMSQGPWIIAFAPIRVITAGGFLAVSYLKNGESTGDIDNLIDPEFAGDEIIKKSLREAISRVSKRLDYRPDWINDDMAVFVTSAARQTLFTGAQKQGITLFKGESLKILAAPLE
jgi:hypothetical protein